VYWATERDRLGIGAPPANAVDPTSIKRRRRAQPVGRIGTVFGGGTWRT